MWKQQQYSSLYERPLKHFVDGRVDAYKTRLYKKGINNVQLSQPFKYQVHPTRLNYVGANGFILILSCFLFFFLIHVVVAQNTVASRWILNVFN